MTRHLAVNEQGFRLHCRPIRDSDIPKLCLPLPVKVLSAMRVLVTPSAAKGRNMLQRCVRG